MGANRRTSEMNHHELAGLIRRRAFLTGASAAALTAMTGFTFGADPQAATSAAPERKGGNPVLDGWYAYPEAAIFGKENWIYPTYSAPYNEQTSFDAFSSPDPVHWNNHPRVLEKAAIQWARRAMWAPSVVEKGGRYYFFFGANDIQNDNQHGGIGVAVADSPAGPFKDHLGKPLVGKFHNGAQPIDQYCFKDQDGTHYLLYGGWRHCNVAKLNDDFSGFVPLPDGTVFKEITPENYVEGPTMFIKDGKYYLMWSEGGWTGPNYSVAYAISESPLGPFKRVARVLQQDAAIATGAGHHSVLRVPGKGGKGEEWFA